MKKSTGFTLIEVLIVIGIIAILAGLVLVAINPARQFAQARDTQRLANLNTILNAIGQNMADNRGIFICDSLSGDSLPTDATEITVNGSEAGPANLACLVPTYIPALPFDPTAGNASTTGYSLYQNSSSGRVHIRATTTEPTLNRSEPLEVVR